METRNEFTGIVPVDRSYEAKVARHNAYTTRCTVGNIVEPKRSNHLTVEELVDFLRGVVDGNKADFAQSLVRYYDSKGFLTSKQETSARRVYAQAYIVLFYNFQQSFQHKWKKEGSALHYLNHVLGTFSSSDYWRCSKCNVLGETSEGNNYSGD